jgi:hypothetical protein
MKYMLEDMVQHTKGLLIQPIDTFADLKKSSLGNSFQHYVILLLIYSVLLGIVSAVNALLSFYDMFMHIVSIPFLGSFLVTKIEILKPLFIDWSLIVVYLIFILLFFGIFLKGCFLHVFVLLFGGEQGIVKTIQIIMYAATPFFLLGWIPYISIIGLLWAMVLCVIGLHIVQQLPIWKAIAVLVIPAVLLACGLMFLVMIKTTFITALSGIL